MENEHLEFLFLGVKEKANMPDNQEKRKNITYRENKKKDHNTRIVVKISKRGIFIVSPLSCSQDQHCYSL